MLKRELTSSRIDPLTLKSEGLRHDVYLFT
jgi:hypothetical protein